MSKLVKPQGSEGAPLQDESIPIHLNVPGLSLTFENDWIIDTSQLTLAKEQQEHLVSRIHQLEQENQLLREKCTRLQEEANLDKFKSQLLVEMLAVSSLDEERSHAQMLQERTKVERLELDLKRLMAQHHNSIWAMEDHASILLMRLRVYGTCIGYCVVSGEFVFVTKDASRYFYPSTADASVLYGHTLYDFLTPLDTQRLHQYVYDVERMMNESVGRRRTSSVAIKEEMLQKEAPFLGTIDGTDTVVRVEITSTPLTFRLQRCIDAVQASDRTRRFSDESVFVIDENEYKSIISNDAYSVATNEEEETIVRNDEECLPIERCSDASLADFAFDFQAEWTDDMHIEVDNCDQALTSGIISPTSVNQF